MRPGADFLSEISQGLVDARENHPFGLSRAGMDKAIEIGPFVARFYRSDGPLPDRSPDLANNRFESEAMLIKRPDLNRGGGILLG